MKYFPLLALLFLSMSPYSAPANPYQNLTAEQQALLRPAVERWIKDQVHQDWKDLWEMQDQTEELKNEILLGQRTAPDMNRDQYVQAMRETMGSGYWIIQRFTLFDIKPLADGFDVIGCGKKKREEWSQTSITFVHVKIVDGKPMFGLQGGNSDPCNL